MVWLVIRFCLIFNDKKIKNAAPIFLACNADDFFDRVISICALSHLLNAPRRKKLGGGGTKSFIPNSLFVFCPLNWGNGQFVPLQAEKKGRIFWCRETKLNSVQFEVLYIASHLLNRDTQKTKFFLSLKETACKNILFTNITSWIPCSWYVFHDNNWILRIYP